MCSSSPFQGPAAKPGKALRVQSDGTELMREVTEARRRIAARRGKAVWAGEESHRRSWEDVTAATEGLLEEGGERE
ncbi:hypothetical protein GUITHDRAFT_119597 [Guillardia theta CCMP2712]|uniref:Uncharacterized protein n=1 Tax=Guillardia theta (strain CCMP2712) TaxID=905079 RepID=L1IDD1_GUITC|nr:hypothetical protein GUITHDRAFT_119597 [Guillardia theta CCMP2712]EKX34248.1 hypothetical protein GUITHDRAFT_119597 [Guillardia theta CCMP2712]|eukprot:XP_005821228.1 hypothetical protein GUITHDRAFT_119597 [Guillardia theta CCMP2712]